MRTRSQSRISNRQQQQVNPTFVEPFNLVEPILVVTMDDTRTMAQLLEAPTVGYEDAIVVPEITADNFELKHACYRFNDLLRASPTFIGFSELLNSILFCNALNSNDQDSLKFRRGWELFLDKNAVIARIIESKSKVRNSRNKPVVAKVSSSSSTPGISPDVAELKDMVKALLLDKKSQAPTPVKAVEESCVTCGGTHSYQNCPATNGNVYRDNIQEFVTQAASANFNQGNTGYRAPIANQIRPPGSGTTIRGFKLIFSGELDGLPEQAFYLVEVKEIILSTNSGQIGVLPNHAPIATTVDIGILRIRLNDTITNPKVDLKVITTRSGVAYQGPTIPTTTSSLPKVVERETEVTKDMVLPTNNGSTKDVQPLVVQDQPQMINSEPVVFPISAPMPNLKSSIPYPSRRNDEKRHEKANDRIEKFYKIFQDMSFEISLADALILMPKFASTLKALIGNKEKLSEMARTPLNKHCSAVILNKMEECLALADLGASINLMPLSVWKKLSLPELTPTCMTLELLTVRLPNQSTERALIDVYEGELTLRVGKEAVTFNLDQTLRYSSNYDDMTANRIDVIEMACEEYSQEVLGFSDVIASGNPTPYYDLIVSTSSPTLTPFGGSDFLLEEVDAFLALEDDPTSPEVDDLL
ncbi:reverse transcriptase domain-containing protein [Tanacetum coccineum]